MFGKGGLGGMMKQAQQMQEKMQKAQEEVANLEVEAEAGAGMVKVVMTGRFDVKRVNIDPSLMDDDKDLLEDLVAAAMNAAVRKVETAKEERMAEVTKGINLPPGMNLPF